MNKNVLKDLPALMIIGTNMVPLFGVFYYHWNLFEVILTYWSETAIIIFYTSLKILKIRGPLYLIALPFSLFPWYWFMGIHLFLICGFFGPHGIKYAHHHLLTAFVPTNLFDYVSKDMMLAFFCLFFSHGMNFIINFIAKKQFLSITPDELQKSILNRIFTMHFTILLGGWLVLLFKAPISGLAVLIIIKIAVDLHLYNKHQSYFTADTQR